MTDDTEYEVLTIVVPVDRSGQPDVMVQIPGKLADVKCYVEYQEGNLARDYMLANYGSIIVGIIDALTMRELPFRPMLQELEAKTPEGARWLN